MILNIIGILAAAAGGGGLLRIAISREGLAKAHGDRAVNAAVIFFAVLMFAGLVAASGWDTWIRMPW